MHSQLVNQFVVKLKTQKEIILFQTLVIIVICFFFFRIRWQNGESDKQNSKVRIRDFFEIILIINQINIHLDNIVVDNIKCT